MNREQRRAQEKSKKQTIDLTLFREEAYDGAQRRINATMQIPDSPGEPVTVGYVIAIEPFIYSEKKVINGSKDEKQDIIGVDSTECLIMDIVVAPNFRKQGIGTFIVEGLKQLYDRMITGARTKEGLSLMKRCGFKVTDSAQLVWIKEKKVVEDEK